MPPEARPVPEAPPPRPPPAPLSEAAWLVGVGFCGGDISELLDRDVDLVLLRALIDHGCPPMTAKRIAM